MTVNDYVWMGITCVSIAWAWIYIEHGEFIRPVLGLILFRRFVIPDDLSPELIVRLFQIGNMGKPVNTITELNDSLKNLNASIDEQSWFKLKEKKVLRQYYSVLLEDLAAKRRSHEWARAFAQKAHERQRQNADRDERPRRASESKSQAWWEVLGIPQNSSSDEIKKSYRKMASKHHPDKGGSVQKMQAINQAYEQAKNWRDFT